MTFQRLERTESAGVRAIARTPKTVFALLTALVACQGDDVAPVAETATSALTTLGSTVLGFENANYWFAETGTTFRVYPYPNHTEGQSAFEVTGQTRIVLNSALLPSSDVTGTKLLLDVFLPSSTQAPLIQMKATVQSRNVIYTGLGGVTPKTQLSGRWQTLEFSFPPSIMPSAGAYSDLILTILTTTTSAPFTCLFDNLRFASEITPVLQGIAQNRDGVTKAVFAYSMPAQSDVTILYGPSNSLSNASGFVASPSEAPPTVFTSRSHAAFAVSLGNGPLTWQIGSRSATATTSSTQLPSTTASDGSRVVTLPDGSKLNIDANVPQDPTPVPEPATNAPFFGTLKGSLSVDPNGAAVYTVPIAIPPGVAGMAPNLSLVYNSQSGNGIAGQGWNLSGLSLIHRCPRTKLQDDIELPVRLGSLEDDGQSWWSGSATPIPDALCLDGQRLFQQADGSFKREIDDFSTITKSADGNTFTVKTKSGDTRYYGLRPESRVAGWMNYITIWALDKVVDAWGNYYELHYNDDHSDFDSRGLLVTTINYTGHQATPGQSSSTVTPTNWITFAYQDRPDPRRARFFKTSPLVRTQRLSSISTPLGTYTLNYKPDADPMLPSRLNSISYCSGYNCLQALTFEWQGGGYSWTRAPEFDPKNELASYGMLNGTQLVDLDMDGRPEFLGQFSGAQITWKNTAQGWQPAPSSWNLPRALWTGDGWQYGMLADLDGDRRPDVVYAVPSDGGTWRVAYLNRLQEGQGWVRATGYESWAPIGNYHFSSITNSNYNMTLADVNGDGLADLVLSNAHDNSLWIDAHLNTGTEFSLSNSGPQWAVNRQSPVPTSGGHLEDFNRDGLLDWVSAPDPDQSAIAIMPNMGRIVSGGKVWGDMSTVGVPAAKAADGTRLLGDVDGDGLPDVVRFEQPNEWNSSGQCTYSGLVGVFFGTGVGYSYGQVEGYQAALSAFAPPAISDYCGSYTARAKFVFSLVDLNADGLADFVLNKPNGGQVLVNTGATWRDLNGATGWLDTAGANAVPLVPNQQYRATFGATDLGSGTTFVDLDGNGVLDLIQGDIERRAWLNTFQPPLITKFPNELAPKTEVGYSVITSAAAQADGTYADDLPLLNPPPREGGLTGVTAVALPLRVVKSVSADNGLGTGETVTTTYQYRALRMAQDRRGPQGFNRVIVKTPSHATGSSGTDYVVTETTYSQLFPYTGMPTQVVKRFVAAGGGPEVTLSSTVSKYCDSLQEASSGLVCSPNQNALNTYPFGTSLFVYPATVTETTTLLSGLSPVGSVETTTDYRYDSWGNPIRVKVNSVRSEAPLGTNPTWKETVTKETVNRFGANGSVESILGKLTEAVATATRQDIYGSKSVTHTTFLAYSYVNSFVAPDGTTVQTPALTKKKVEPGVGSPIEVHTAYAYDRFGNVTITTTCAADFASCTPDSPGPSSQPNRTTKVSYDPADFNSPSGPGLVGALAYGAGRFPVKTTNAMGHVEYSAYDLKTGGLLQTTGPNGLHTCYKYDVFGTKTAEVARCGSEAPLTTTFGRFFKTPGDHYPAVVVTIARTPTGSASWVYTDALGRTIATVGRHFNGGFVESAASYDTFGRMSSETKPHMVGDAAYPSTVEYDSLGRTSRAIQPLGGIGDRGGYGIDTRTYRGSMVSSGKAVSDSVRNRSEQKNLLGKVASVVDDTNAAISYFYDPDGNLIQTWDAANNAIGIQYDLRGRKIQTDDPDMGTWTYAYNGFGDLISQTDAAGQTTTMTYDRLGRMTSRTDASGTSEWVYDVATGAGVGKLAAMVSAPDSRLNGACTVPYVTTTGGNRAGRWFKYTKFGEVQETSECTDGETFVTSFQYDSFGRQAIVQYPTVAGKRLAVENHYTSLGFLQYVTDLSDASVLWAALDMNALGQVTRERTGNRVATISTRNPVTGWLMNRYSTSANGGSLLQNWSYKYDEDGNLLERGRSNTVNGADSQETFTYDSLNRLKTSRVVVGTEWDATESFSYDNLGNLTLKGGNTYYYNMCRSGWRASGPHAVCWAGNDAMYEYDLNGNMTAGRGRTLTYNPSNKITNIVSSPSPSQGANDSGVVDFIYGADASRVVQSVSPLPGASGSTARTVYVGLGATGKSLYERTTTTGSSTVEHVHFIYAGAAHDGSAFALRVLSQTGASVTSTTKYNHFDHLGSVVAMSDEQGGIPTTSGADADVMGYDAWGARRAPNGLPANPATFNQRVGRREFTGHETISKTGLINMNGRVYDPVLGRFLSPDPNVQFVANLQSYNRYSYVENNPLRYTDPTGYFLGHGFDAVVNLGLALAAGAVCGPAAPGCVLAFGLAAVAYNTASAWNEGAGFNQVAFVAISSLAMNGITGGVGGAIGKATSPLIGGAVSGMIQGAYSTAMSGGGWGDLGKNVFSGAVEGALMSSLAFAISNGRLSKADVARGYVNGSGAEKLEFRVVRRTFEGSRQGSDGSEGRSGAEDTGNDGAGGNAGGANDRPNGRFTPDQEAVVDLAKRAEAQKGVPREDAKTLVEWGKEAGFGNRSRGPENHGGESGEHIHVGPVDHIPVLPQVSVPSTNSAVLGGILGLGALMYYAWPVLLAL